MAEQNQPKRNLLSEFSLRLEAEPVNGERRGPTLGIIVRKNRPIIEVRTNVTNDKDYGRIQGRMSTPTFYTFIEMLKKIAEGPNDTKYTITLADFRFIRNNGRGERSKEPMTDAKVVVGKDKEGITYLACLSWEQGRPIIKFPLRDSPFDRYTDNAGQPLDAGLLSTLKALGWVRLLSHLVPFVLADEYWEKPRDDQQGGGGGGGNRNWGGNNGGGGGNRGGGNYGGNGGGASGGGAPAAGGAADAVNEDDFPF